tara:strand:- start:472 stop:927 length:456 start_codon:yes stop_codon:yes gene_type:complete
MKKELKNKKALLVIDLYIDNDNKYNCLCDVPKNERVYEEDCENNDVEPNSMLLKVKSEDALLKFENEMENNPHILYAVGREIVDTPKLTREEWLKEVVKEFQKQDLDCDENKAEGVVNTYPDFIKLCEYHNDGRNPSDIAEILITEFNNQI